MHAPLVEKLYPNPAVWCRGNPRRLQRGGGQAGEEVNGVVVVSRIVLLIVGVV